MITKILPEKVGQILVEAHILGREICFPPITIDFNSYTPQNLISELVRRTYIPDLTCSRAYFTIENNNSCLIPIEDLYKSFTQLGYKDNDKIIIRCPDESLIYVQ